MDAVKFLQERSRMYKSGAVTPGYDYDPVIAVKVVEEWSAAHPRKTRQSVFLEQWPQARVDDNGCVKVCPGDVSATHRDAGGGCAKIGILCPNCRREFWMQVVM